tara:strand:- start:23660 stop:23935 length:276 start_codon:yes stop_codon:yes gene_type:complete
METFQHDLPNLFDQLGLDSSPDAIDQFAQDNKLKKDQKITDASCWNAAQIRFLEKELEQDSEWCIAIDQLAELMYEPVKDSFFCKIMKLFR